MVTCLKCGKQLGATGYGTHMAMHDREALKPPAEEKPHKCPHCSDTAKTERGLAIHVAKMHGASGAARRAKAYPHLSRVPPVSKLAPAPGHALSDPEEDEG